MLPEASHFQSPANTLISSRDEALVLLRAITPMAEKWGLEECEYSWVAESNRLSRGSLEKGGAERVKTYRVYDWAG